MNYIERRLEACSKDTLSTAEVAEAFGVSKASVLRWYHKGAIRAVRVGGRNLRYPIDEVRRCAAGGAPSMEGGK